VSFQHHNEITQGGPMEQERTSLEPGTGAIRSLRRRLGLKAEFALALLPTLTVLTVLWLVEALSHQRLLFASLASSAFLIYLDPQHGTNSVRTLVIAQVTAAVVGLVIYLALGPGYLAGGSAMVTTIVLMILLDAMHPPAVSTALTFAFRSGTETSIVLFGVALSIVVVLVVLQRLTVRLLARFSKH
jgi:CBS-domain-containing membrane protein